MKKTISLILALLLCLSLCACGNGSDSPAQTATNDTKAQAKNQFSGDTEFLSCRFADEVHAADGELTAMLYQQIDGKVYVDLVFSVNNQTSEEISEEQISGWLIYQDVNTTLQYCRDNSVSTAVEKDPVLPGEHAYVHLFTRLPAEAENEKLTVHYTINGQEYQCDVAAKDTRDALSVKTEVHTGDVVDVPYSSCKFEVLDARVVENLQATNQKDTYYSGPFVLVKLQVTNNHPTHTLDDILAYTESDGEYYRFSTDVEINDNTDFASFAGIAPGESKTVAIYHKVSDVIDRNNVVVRFNVAGSCYYVNIK